MRLVSMECKPTHSLRQAGCDETKEGRWEWYLYLILAVLAIFGPAIVLPHVGLYWGALVYFTVAVLWLSTMPSTCMTGGLLCSMISMPIALAGLVVPLFAIGKFIMSLLR
jgi:hypothetical protein